MRVSRRAQRRRDEPVATGHGRGGRRSAPPNLANEAAFTVRRAIYVAVLRRHRPKRRQCRLQQCRPLITSAATSSARRTGKSFVFLKNDSDVSGGWIHET
jgi:hypothetical protein